MTEKGEFYPGWADDAGRKAGEADRRTYGSKPYDDVSQIQTQGRREASGQRRVRRLMVEGSFMTGAVGVDTALKDSEL